MSHFLVGLIRRERIECPLVLGLGFTLEKATLIRILSAVGRGGPAAGAQVAGDYGLGGGLHGGRRGPLLAQKDGLHGDVLKGRQVERGAKLRRRVISL